ncbi:GNAT family N-acetyltransferase [Protaetiibacter mangrovi]|uniref:GNAT family N-acetyltransferase n=1 Tax=Protaetiibacter mangrovi TaxID=2970926 RepID=A0ABT1ZFP5_9MICO|nr:GNAT family N-acetyltransferase [Protaetiibacter mangrovi]MCS0499531.1 GNAT family N-acetyltransferase [Protaetiibacter mangrovi]TPX03104.1 GNAT family N-acetyltransferase [Schumannella luteola]
MEPVVLRTERLVLSPARLDDVDHATALLQEPVMATMLASLPWPYTRADSVHYIGTMVPAGWASGDALSWAIRESADGPPLGDISWRPPRGDVGYWLGAPYRGRGYMTEALRAVVDWVFARTPELDRVGWEAVVGNVASARVARAAGFRYDGERPVEIDFRDGTRPMGWHGYRLRDDDGGVHAGWPL